MLSHADVCKGVAKEEDPRATGSCSEVAFQFLLLFIVKASAFSSTTSCCMSCLLPCFWTKIFSAAAPPMLPRALALPLLPCAAWCPCPRQQDPPLQLHACHVQVAKPRHNLQTCLLSFYRDSLWDAIKYTKDFMSLVIFASSGPTPHSPAKEFIT